MSAVSSRPEVAAAQPAAGTRVGVRPSDALLPAALGLWVAGVSRTDASHLGGYGLLGVLPIIFYLGLGLLVVSAAIELARPAISRVRMALHAVALVVMLYATAPLVYPEGRYSWLYKTIGVVQYVNAHGQLNSSIDIYQNWPGFFAFAAWFDKVAGVASPLAYAKWAQLIAELAALPLLHMAYNALSLPARQRWVAVLLYSAGNWIAQDYFSPQALATLFSLGVMAIALRWMFAGNAAGPAGRRGQRDQSPRSRHRYWARWRIRRALPFVLTLILVFSVLTFTHELSPYVVLLQIGCLAVTGLVRPRWVPFVLAAVAIGYLAPHFAFVNSHFGLLSSLGDFFSNAAPPSLSGSAPVPASEAVIQNCARVLAGGVWVGALIGAWLRRRSRRTALALTVLAYSPIVVLALGAYGDEGVLRVYMFSLPWSAALVAAAVAPLPVLARPAQRAAGGLARWLPDWPDGWLPGRALRAAGAGPAAAVPAGGAPAAVPPGPRVPTTKTSGSRAVGIRAAVVLAAAVALFLPAFFGDDAGNTVSRTEVDTLASFLQTAPAGAIFTATEGAPLADTARYNLFTIDDIFGAEGIIRKTTPPPDAALMLARAAVDQTGGLKPSYAMITPAMVAYNTGHPVTTSNGLQLLIASLNRSALWVPILKSHGLDIYELPAGSQPAQQGTTSPKPPSAQQQAQKAAKQQAAGKSAQ